MYTGLLGTGTRVSVDPGPGMRVEVEVQVSVHAELVLNHLVDVAMQTWHGVQVVEVQVVRKVVVER